MNKDMAQGKAKQVKGKMDEEMGKATGNKSREMKGNTEQVTGKLREEYGKVKRSIKKVTKT
jgi:uncharacterized protein YjbJ (UPF0337 family)